MSHFVSRGQSPRAYIARYRCPYCVTNPGRWSNGEPCHHCAGQGTVDDPSPGIDLAVDLPAGVEPPETQATPLPRPPAVMKTPCPDCAFRPGSPEQRDGLELDPAVPFYCHHGMTQVDRPNGSVDYLAAAWVGPLPLGYMVCAGWWAAG